MASFGLLARGCRSGGGNLTAAFVPRLQPRCGGVLSGAVEKPADFSVQEMAGTVCSDVEHRCRLLQGIGRSGTGFAEDGRRIRWQSAASAAGEEGSGVGVVPGFSPADEPQSKGPCRTAVGHFFGQKSDDAMKRLLIRVCGLPALSSCCRSSGDGGGRRQVLVLVSSEDPRDLFVIFFSFRVLSAVVCGQLSFLYHSCKFQRPVSVSYVI